MFQRVLERPLVDRLAAVGTRVQLIIAEPVELYARVDTVQLEEQVVLVETAGSTVGIVHRGGDDDPVDADYLGGPPEAEGVVGGGYVGDLHLNVGVTALGLDASLGKALRGGGGEGSFLIDVSRGSLLRASRYRKEYVAATRTDTPRSAVLLSVRVFVMALPPCQGDEDRQKPPTLPRFTYEQRTRLVTGDTSHKRVIFRVLFG